MEMEDQYGMADLRQLMVNGRPHFPTIPQQPPDLFSGHRNLTPSQHHYEMMMVGRDMMPRGLHDSAATTATTTTITVTASSTATLSGLETEAGCLLGADAGTGRWPRQETLTLLEIRSRLDPKFKEANQKGPLWDEVSRIMSEEHGYQRSGKKCREKFENLYKYYKKTKEGKAGRQDGKHYRFFRQLEALYGESSINNPVSVSETHLVGSNTLRFHTSSNTPTPANQEAFQAPKLCDSLSLSNNSSEFDTSSSDDNDLNATATLMDNEYSAEKSKKRRGRRNWKVKIRDFIDFQMRKLMEKQEAWLEKMMKTIEHKEQERILREEEWRKEEAARLEREHKFWANERAWIQARDVALMDALQKLTGGEVLKQVSSPSDQELINESHETFNVNVKCGGNRWPESEISRLIQLRSNMESRFQQMGCREEILWEEISAKMGCLGYERSPLMCKDKWDSINNYLRKTKECNKKRKENSNSKSCCYYQNNDHNSVVLYNQGGGGGGAYSEINEQGPETGRGLQTNDGSSPSNSNAAGNNPHVHDNCFRFLMGDGENLWDSYGTVKLNKGEN